jgi:phosphoribosylanthranilate isomerase
MKTWIKFCAQTNAEDALASFECGADAVGFVFAESSRRVTEDQVKRVIARLPAAGEKIGVFVNESSERIAQIVRETGLNGVQLQGDETEHELERLRTLLPAGIRVTKTVRAGAAEIPSAAADAILIDSGNTHQRGGTGQIFDWHGTAGFVERLRQNTPVIIAGGLRPENVGQAIRLFRPFGVDVATGIEAAPGKKDRTKMREFVAAVREAENT